MKREEKKYELSSEQAKDMVRSYPNAAEEDGEIAGAIFDQDEATKFLQWLGSPEAKEIGKQIKAQRSQGKEW